MEKQEQTDADDIASACASLSWEIRNHPTFLSFQAWKDWHLSISPPKLWIAQNIATDSLLAEPEKLADAHLREMETQQNEMFFKLYLVDALQTQSLNAEVASASFESEENVHDEDYVSGDQEVY